MHKGSLGADKAGSGTTTGIAASLGRIHFQTSGDVHYLHTSSHVDWQGAFLTHCRTGASGSFQGCWSSLGLSAHLPTAPSQSRNHVERQPRPDERRLRLGVPGRQYSGQWTSPFESVNLFISPTQIETILQTPYSDSLVLDAEAQLGQDPVLEHLLQALLADVESGNSDGPLLGETIIAAVAQRLHPRRHARQGVASARFSPKELRNLQLFVRENIARPLHLDDLARHLDISVRHLSRTLRLTLGIAPHQYVVHSRVEHAKHLLTSGKLTLDEIAEASGFADSNHMSTSFRRVLHVTPSHIRRGAS